MSKIYKLNKEKICNGVNLETLKIEDRTALVEDWLLNSGIQAKEGGFYAWQDIENNSYSYLYSEITGYAITALCFLYALTKNNIFITKATDAASWIINKAIHPTGGVLTRDYIAGIDNHYSFQRANIYAFDCAMVSFGMLKLYKITKEKKYLDTARAIVEFLISNMLKENGLFYPSFDAKNNKTQEDNSKWSSQSGSFHCKLSLCLSDLAEIEKKNYYKDIATNLINSSIKYFYKNGRFLTSISDNTSHLHPYCYTIEGLIYYSYKFNDNNYKDIIEDAFNWILKFQNPDGGMPTKVYEDNKKTIAYERCDIQAQVSRLYYLIKGKKTNSSFGEDALLARLFQFQNLDRTNKGGFFFGTDEDGSYKKHLNSWCSMFALQALYLIMNKSNRNLILEYLV